MAREISPAEDITTSATTDQCEETAAALEAPENVATPESGPSASNANSEHESALSLEPKKAAEWTVAVPTERGTMPSFVNDNGDSEPCKDLANVGELMTELEHWMKLHGLKGDISRLSTEDGYDDLHNVLSEFREDYYLADPGPTQERFNELISRKVSSPEKIKERALAHVVQKRLSDKAPKEIEESVEPSFAGPRALYYHTAFESVGWPGFENFENAVQGFMWRFLKTTIDSPDLDPDVN